MQTKRGGARGQNRNGNGMGGRGPRRLTASRESQGARPGSRCQPRREWVRDRGGDGRRIRKAQNSPLTSHSPARPSLGPSGRSRRPGPASSAAPFRVTQRAHALRGIYGSHRGPQAGAAEQRASGACVVPTGCCVGGALQTEPGIAVTLLLCLQQ